MKRGSRRIVIKTPPGQPDEGVSAKTVLYWAGALSGAVIFVLNLIIFKAQADTKDQLRKEMNDQVAAVRKELNDQIIDMRKTTWPQFYTKAEMDERRKELDRREQDRLTFEQEMRNAIMELKLHDAQDHNKGR